MILNISSCVSIDIQNCTWIYYFSKNKEHFDIQKISENILSTSAILDNRNMNYVSSIYINTQITDLK